LAADNVTLTMTKPGVWEGEEGSYNIVPRSISAPGWVTSEGQQRDHG
jgi:hypothetical protein